MTETLTLTAPDGHTLGAYLARPKGPDRAGLVVCQEIFGVNAHIRDVCDSFAAEGYLTIAPALFDRHARGVELPYTEEGTAKGRAYRTALAWDTVMADIAVAVEAVSESKPVGVVGYCWGGSLAWLSACRLPVKAAVGYYGGQIHEHRAETPQCPVLLHFGERDPLIDNTHVLEIGRLHPEVEIHTYDAGHGFNCDKRADHAPDAAALARTRTLEFLGQHLG